MDIVSLLETLESSDLAAWLRESGYAFPLVESFHVIAITMVFGAAAIIDLRLLGLASVRRPFSEVASDVLKWIWVAFALAVTTGLLMFITKAQVYYENPQFRAKMSLLLLSGINLLIFELTTHRTVHRWNNDKAAPPGGQLAAAFSLLFWISVIFLGRWIGFTAGADLKPDVDINIEDFLK